MEGYVKPEIVEISDMMETVGLLSGELQGGDTLHLFWTNHDSGSHSVLWVGIYSKEEGNRNKTITLTLNAYPNRKIKAIRNAGSRSDIMPVSYAGDGKTLTITQNFHTNGNETYQLTLEIEFEDGPFDPIKSDPVVVGQPTYEWGGDGFTSGSYCVPNDKNDSRFVPRTGIYYPTGFRATPNHNDPGNAREHWTVS